MDGAREPAPASADGAGRSGPADGRAGLAVKAVALVAVGMGVPALGLAIAWRSCGGRAAAAGRIEVAGATLGSWQAPLVRCASLASTGLRGVALLPATGDVALATVVIDALDGPLLTLRPTTGDRTLALRGRDCPGLTAELRGGDGDSDGDDANRGEAPRFDGAVRGACALPGGGTLTIDVWWRGC